MPTQSHVATHRVVVRLPAVQRRVGLTESTIYERMAAGLFPRPIKIGPRAVGWIESEIDDWIEARMAERQRAEESSHA